MAGSNCVSFALLIMTNLHCVRRMTETRILRKITANLQKLLNLVLIMIIAIDLSRISLQCVQTIAPERNWCGHFRTFAVFLPIMT